MVKAAFWLAHFARRCEKAFIVQLTALDWDKLSSNEYIVETSFNVRELLVNAPQMEPETRLCVADQDGDHAMKDLKVDVQVVKEMPCEAKRNPVTFRWVSYSLLV